jgi:hypothetical protein
MVKPGCVVGLIVGGESARGALVLAQRENPGNAEPLLDVVATWLSPDGSRATSSEVRDVPFTDDAPGGHYRWTYSGPEVLVRKAVADPALATEGGANPGSAGL